jgi:cysteine-rich repeat protein
VSGGPCESDGFLGCCSPNLECVLGTGNPPRRICGNRPVCGNGITTPGEDCDDGNTVDTDGCTNDCRLPRCGDGIVSPSAGERCDDENSTNTDGCTNACQLPRCGDLIISSGAGEVCDDGNTVAGDGCNPSCTSDETCGNDFLDPGELCESNSDCSPGFFCCRSFSCSPYPCECLLPPVP